MKRIYWHWLAPLPVDLAPSDEIVYAGQAVLGAGFVLLIGYAVAGAALLCLLHHPVPQHLLAWTQTVLSALTLERRRFEAEYWSGMGWEMRGAFAGTLLIAFLLAAIVLRSGLRPVPSMRHLSGPQRWTDAAALTAAQNLDAGRTDVPYLRIHPEVKRPKGAWNRHAAILGSVGSGKSQVLYPIVRRIVGKPQARLILYDSKGDYTSALLHHRHARLLCPWDVRTAVWDVAADVQTLPEIQSLAAAVIPADTTGQSAFWKNSAMDVLIGILTSCIAEHGIEWGWVDVAARLQWSQEDLHALLMTYAPQSAALLKDPKSTTAASLLSTLSVETAVIHDFARGWRDPDAERVSLRAWCSDAPMEKHGPRCLIVQAGPEPRSSGAMMAAIVNTVASAINSPLLPDDETRERFLVLDELQSIGRTRFPELVERGRSKGFSVLTAMQDLLQLGPIYGEPFVKSFPGMVGTLIIAQLQLGGTRQQIAEWFGKARWAQTTHSHSAGEHGPGMNRSTSEVETWVVQPHEITDDLGVKRIKGKPVIRAILAAGGDLLTLDWPITPVPKRSLSRVPAPWTLAAPPPTEARRDRGQDSTSTLRTVEVDPAPNPLDRVQSQIRQLRQEATTC